MDLANDGPRLSLRPFVLRTSCFLLLGIALASLVPRAARGETLELLYDPGDLREECPDAAEFWRQLVARQPTLSRGAGDVLQVNLQRGPDGFQASAFRLRDGRVAGVRSVGPNPDCTKVVSALAFAVSVSSLGTPARRTPLRVPSLRDSGGEVQAPPVEGQFRLALGGAFQLFTSYGPSPGAQLEISWRRPRFSAALGGWIEAWTSRQVSGGELRGGTSALSLAGCFRASRLFQACPVGVAGIHRTEAFGLPNPRRVATPFLAVGPRAELEVPLGLNVSAVLQAEVLASLHRTFLAVGEEEVWRASPVSFRAALLLSTVLGDGFSRSPQ